MALACLNNFEQTAKCHRQWLWFASTKSTERMISFSDYSTHFSVGVWEPACSVASHSNFPQWTNTCCFCTGFHPSSHQGGGDSDEPMAAYGPSKQVTQICLTSGGGVWWVHLVVSAKHISIYMCKCSNNNPHPQATPSFSMFHEKGRNTFGIRLNDIRSNAWMGGLAIWTRCTFKNDEELFLLSLHLIQRAFFTKARQT